MCGCSKNSSVPFVMSNTSPIIVNPEDCTTTLEEIINKKNYLDQLKNSTNSHYINANIGLLDSMINIGNYCLYNIASMSI